MIGDILSIGLRDGLIWFPLVLGVGLLYSKFKEIDLSVDGVTVISGIVSGLVWNATRSYALSIIAAIVTGAALSGLVSLLAWKLRIGFLMSGIVFSLGAHAASVLWIGESMALNQSSLMPGFQTIPLWLPLVAVLLGIAFEAFLRTNLGIDLRRIGGGIELNSRRSPFRLRALACMIAGGGYGLASALLVHSEGVARCGTGFDYLLVGVCSYLCAARLIELSSRAASKSVGPEQAQSVSVVHGWKRVFIESWGWTSLRAVIGAVLFQCVIFVVMVKSPNPSAWKLIMAVTLLIVLVRWPARTGRMAFHSDTTREETGKNGTCAIKDIHYAYDTGSEVRPVFTGASAEFPVGLTIVQGDNGVGKSTLIKILSGQLSPKPGGAIHPARPSAYFTVPQRIADSLSPDLTVYENLAAAIPLTEKPPVFPGIPFVATNLRRSLEEAGLLQSLQSTLLDAPFFFSENDPIWLKPSRDLSGGQALMVAILCSVLARKQVILMDEPSTGLDPINFARLTILLQGLARRRAVIVTSHDDRLTALSPAKAVLAEGKIILS